MEHGNSASKSGRSSTIGLEEKDHVARETGGSVWSILYSIDRNLQVVADKIKRTSPPESGLELTYVCAKVTSASERQLTRPFF